jgi:hypothetical protein
VVRVSLGKSRRAFFKKKRQEEPSFLVDAQRLAHGAYVRHGIKVRKPALRIPARERNADRTNRIEAGKQRDNTRLGVDLRVKFFGVAARSIVPPGGFHLVSMVAQNLICVSESLTAE